MKINVYTDGACSLQSENSPGGWGVVAIIEDTVSKVGGYELETTNNKMELLAFLEGLKLIKNIVESSEVFLEECNIYTDSAYISNCFKDKWYVNWRRNGWKTSKKEPVKNVHLWESILKEYESLNKYGIKVEKVKGHSDDKYNNLVDLLAVQCKNRREYFEDINYLTV